MALTVFHFSIRESSRLRMLIPRVYGLGDLSQILDERAHTQAQEILSALGDDLGKFVITEAYQRSAKALVEHGFCPAARRTGMRPSRQSLRPLGGWSAGRWGCLDVQKFATQNEFVTHSNPNEPKQFFWVDDAFGATQFDWSSASKHGTGYSHIMHARYPARGASAVSRHAITFIIQLANTSKNRRSPSSASRKW